MVHAGDLALTPVLLPFDLEPLAAYRFDEFPYRVRERRARELEWHAILLPVGIGLVLMWEEREETEWKPPEVPEGW